MQPPLCTPTSSAIRYFALTLLIRKGRLPHSSRILVLPWFGEAPIPQQFAVPTNGMCWSHGMRRKGSMSFGLLFGSSRPAVAMRLSRQDSGFKC